MKTSLTKIASAACAPLSQASAFGQAYHSNNLTPAGSSSGKLTGRSGGRQVGVLNAANGYPHAVMLWSGAVTGTANPTTVTIAKDTSVTANFG